MSTEDKWDRLERERLLIQPETLQKSRTVDECTGHANGG